MFKKTIPALRPAMLPAGLLCGLFATLAGCGGDNSDNVQYGGTLLPEEPREVSHEGMTDADYGNLDRADVGLHITWARNLISRDPVPDAPVARLTDVAAESLDGFDRIAFTFDPRVAGYELQLVEEGGGGCDGTEPGAGGVAQLAIEFPRTVSNDGGTALVAARDLALDFPTLVRALQTCDEGDTVRWLLAAGSEIEYRLLEVRMGNTIVVDLRTPPEDASNPGATESN